MKTNFSLDLALFFTCLSIVLYSCGYFYIKSYTEYFEYTHESLGFDFQNYLIYGGLQGSQVIILGILIPITLSLINNLIKKNISKTLSKVFSYIIITIILFIVKIIVCIFKIFYYPVEKISNFIYKFNKLSTYLEAVILFTLMIILSPILLLIKLLIEIINLIKPTVVLTHNIAKTESNWDSAVDTPNVDEGFKELITHYLSSLVIYLLFFLAIYYLINIEKDGHNDAQKRIKDSQSISLIIKDEKINQWYSENKIKEPSTKEVKILICGKVKCLIAVKVPYKISYTQQNLITIKSYLYTTIDNYNYSVF
ncbi:hypothetical protein [Acinetobacter sp. ANC 3832]|uniref:hypothetical protein n=1 Tax=Acinetobacter sp. ANC 3832 TaxID=1977874 RepID=UPI000A33F2A5|nr:hypothetical protein [Acinetobacter sp. ANC 3832]OTG93677.1 hypothetical protein B9T35_08105 [Acinetobacter sp. ANC 3832]